MGISQFRSANHLRSRSTDRLCQGFRRRKSLGQAGKPRAGQGDGSEERFRQIDRAHRLQRPGAGADRSRPADWSDQGLARPPYRGRNSALRGAIHRAGINDAPRHRRCERAGYRPVSRRRREALTMAETLVRRTGGRGRFVSFEGGEGSGKSTQIRMLAERLAGVKLQAIVTREPGGSPGAEIIRHLVLSGMGKLLGPEAETLLFAAARDDHARTVIEPALKRGVWVLSDRFSDSTRVYQGALGQVSPGILNAMQRVTIGDLKPDLTIILDVPVEVGLKRAALRRGTASPDRFEQEDVKFHQQLREAYRQIAANEPERCVLIDATQEANKVAANVWSALRDRFFTAGADSTASPA